MAPGPPCEAWLSMVTPTDQARSREGADWGVLFSSAVLRVHGQVGNKIKFGCTPRGEAPRTPPFHVFFPKSKVAPTGELQVPSSSSTLRVELQVPPSGWNSRRGSRAERPRAQPGQILTRGASGFLFPKFVFLVPPLRQWLIMGPFGGHFRQKPPY